MEEKIKESERPESYKGAARLARITRAPFLQVSIIPVAVAGAFAFKEGTFDFLPFIFSLLAIVFLHLGVNTINDYYDHLQKADELNIRPTPFSGGSRVIQQRLENPRTVLTVAVICFVLAVVFGMYVVFLRGITLLIISLIGLIFGIFYTAPPLKLVYRGLGEFTVFVLLGPLALAGAEIAIAGEFSRELFFASIPIGIWVMLILVANEFPDAEFDARANKNHLVVVMGKKSAAYMYAVFAYLSFIVIAVGVGLDIMSVTTLLVLLAFKPAYDAVKFLVSKPEREDYMFTQQKTIQTDLLVGILFVVSFILANFL